MRAGRESRRKQERAIATFQFADGKLECTGQRRAKAAVIGCRIALLARFVFLQRLRNNCGAPVDGHVDHPGMFGGRTTETRKAGSRCPGPCCPPGTSLLLSVEFVFGLARENGTGCGSHRPNRRDSLSQTTFSFQMKSAPSFAPEPPALRSPHQDWSHIRTAQDQSAPPCEIHEQVGIHRLLSSRAKSSKRNRSKRRARHAACSTATVIVTSQQRGCRAHALSPMKHIALRTRHYRATVFNACFS